MVVDVLKIIGTFVGFMLFTSVILWITFVIMVENKTQKQKQFRRL